MMKSSNWRIILGIGLVGLGIITLMQALGIISYGGLFLTLLVSGLFLVGGLAFLSILLKDRAQWWPIIPGGILLDLGLLILFTTMLPSVFNHFAGSFFLGSLGIVFFLVYLYHRPNWWAIIPGGVLLTLSAVAGLDRITVLDMGGVFFIGLAATFALLAVLPIREPKMTWPLIPAGILFVMGMLISFSSSQYANYIWPIALILGGLFLVFRTTANAQ